MPTKHFTVPAVVPIYADMRDKVALVTGGSSGIGLGRARAFARQYARVVIASRDERTAKRCARTLAKDGDIQWLPADVADSKSVARLMRAVIEKHGQLDYAFNNGGSGGRSAPVAVMTETAWRKTIDGGSKSAIHADEPVIDCRPYSGSRRTPCGGF
jgi:NAD(P)-dependent dehydrogenase (short-subunit alcohol dehydrogenase family)